MYGWMYQVENSWKALELYHGKTRVRGISQAPCPRCATPHSATSGQGHYYLKHCESAPAALFSHQNQHFYPNFNFLPIDAFFSPHRYHAQRVLLKTALSRNSLGKTFDVALLSFLFVAGSGGWKGTLAVWAPLYEGGWDRDGPPCCIWKGVGSCHWLDPRQHFVWGVPAWFCSQHSFIIQREVFLGKI